MSQYFNSSLFKKQLKIGIQSKANEAKPELIKNFEDFFKTVTGNYIRDSYSFEEMMDWFRKKEEQFPDSTKGFIRLTQNTIRGCTLFLSLLDEDNQPYINKDNGTVVASKICTKTIDNEILEHLGDSQRIILT